MNSIRFIAGLLALATGGTLVHAQGIPSEPAPGTDVSYVCGGGTVIDVEYRSRAVARVNFGGVGYTLTRRNVGPVQYGGVIRYSDPVTSWNLGGQGAFLNQNGQTLVSGCQPINGGGSSTVIPVGPGGGSSTIIPVPGFGPSSPGAGVVNTVNYTCDGGQGVTVSYLGPGTAQVFWQGETDTFYQTESGSGVRYTNGFYTWVTKGNQGFLQQKGLTQDSIVVVNNCVARS